MAKALALCPALKVLQYDFLQYEQVSEQVLHDLENDLEK